MTFTLPPLPYAYDALQPYMSQETLEFHHDKHHKAYVDNLNKLVIGTEFEGKSLEEITVRSFERNAPIFNNAAQDYNHTLFWNWMKPGGGGVKLPARLEKSVIASFGSLAQMRETFLQTGISQFGSGWAWVSVKDGALVISKTDNGVNPLVHDMTPILGCDVWEHSYYIDYRNRRPDYVTAFFDNLINWEYVDFLLGKAL